MPVFRFSEFSDFRIFGFLPRKRVICISKTQNFPAALRAALYIVANAIKISAALRAALYIVVNTLKIFGGASRRLAGASVLGALP